ncbi:MAG: hypothetical protein HY716_08915 [Planctomycetes bacterium]|nr:hypothetical protein [Planctomycetota bacterium]
MKLGIALTSLLGVLMASRAEPCQAKNCVAWADSWGAALQEARERNVPILLTVQQDENPGCDAMFPIFNGDGGFIRASRQVVCVMAYMQFKDRPHGTRKVKVGNQVVEMCKVINGITCEVHERCVGAVANFMSEAKFDIPVQIWVKPDGKEMRDLRFSGVEGQSAGEMLSAMKKALDKVPGPKLSRDGWEKLNKLLQEGSEHLAKYDFKKSIETYKKVKDAKVTAPHFTRKAEEALASINQHGEYLVEEAKQLHATDPKKAKEDLERVAKDFKGLAASQKAEEALKTLK